jgi:hypothetical protein
MVRREPGYLEAMSFRIQEVFPQICSDIARGQDLKNMKSVWEGGRSFGPGLLDGDSENGDDDDSNNLSGLQEPFGGDDTSDQQQRRGVTVKLAPLNHYLPAERV